MTSDPETLCSCMVACLLREANLNQAEEMTVIYLSGGVLHSLCDPDV